MSNGRHFTIVGSLQPVVSDQVRLARDASVLFPRDPRVSMINLHRAICISPQSFGLRRWLSHSGRASGEQK